MQEQDLLLTLDDWRQAYLDGASPRGLLTACAARLGQGDPAVWIHRVGAEALEARIAELEALIFEAESLGDLLARLPLFGVPFAAKDNIDVAGMPTTAACPAFEHMPEAGAHVVQRLLDAGAVCMGKTNLDQFATGLVGARSPYGVPVCVFDAGRISGGSSSGSAVAVARGEVAFSLGTDTAGSGRVPAGFNNLVGLKPTPGRVSTRGVLPACRTLDCVSVFAHSVGDAAAVQALIEGPDEADAYSQFAPGPARLPERLRLGVPAAPGFPEAGYAQAWLAAQQQARKLGHEIAALDFASLHEVADLLYQGPWVAERHAVVQELLEREPEAIEPTVRRVIEGALGRSATDAFRAQYKLRAAQRGTALLWNEVDLLMVPTAVQHPSFAQLAQDPLGVNTRLGRFTNFVNLLGWCALALPAGFTAEQLPFGVTFIGPANHDAALARFGLTWLPGEPGPAWPAVEATLPIAVVGAHLSGMPLNWQLTARGATLRAATHTAPHYRLYALAGTVPPKPGLQRVSAGGAAIAVEVWDLPIQHVGSLLALIPPPLGLGTLELADGSPVQGFICEGHALKKATDITAFGGWRAYVSHLAEASRSPS